MFTLTTMEIPDLNKRTNFHVKHTDYVIISGLGGPPSSTMMIEVHPMIIDVSHADCTLKAL